MPTKPTLTWETIEPLDEDCNMPQMSLERAAVSGGWLYRATVHSVTRSSTTPISVSICFVPEASKTDEIPY